MMPVNEPVQRVRIYLSERDLSGGEPLYLVVLDRLRSTGATGATAIRGVAGFGAGHRLRTAGTADLEQSPPVVIEWVDRAERVARVLPALDALLPEALITVEEVRVYRAALRSNGPFGDRTVGDVMVRDVVTVALGAPLRRAATLMLEHALGRMPVLDEQGRVAGVLELADLNRQGGASLPLSLIGALDETERAAVVAGLPEQPLAELLTSEPRVVNAGAPVPQAVGVLVEWGLDGLPVVDYEGRFKGFFGVEQALRAALLARGSVDARVRSADPPTPVRLVMQTAVPTIAANAPLTDVLARLLSVPERFLIVVDAGRPVGALGEAQVASRLPAPLRAAWMELLFAAEPPNPATFDRFDTGQTAGELMQSPAPTIHVLDSQDNATLLMLDQGHERLVVVDDAGQLVGLLARRGLLRALAQASAAG